MFLRASRHVTVCLLHGPPDQWSSHGWFASWCKWLVLLSWFVCIIVYRTRSLVTVCPLHLLLLPGWPDGCMFLSRSRPARQSLMLAPCRGCGLPQPLLAVSPSQIVRCCAFMSCQIVVVSLGWSRHCAFAHAPVVLALHTRHKPVSADVVEDALHT